MKVYLQLIPQNIKSIEYLGNQYKINRITATLSIWFILVLSLLVFKTNAQTPPKVDSVYYLVDTAKTPVTDRMWSVYAAGSYNYYTIACTCLKFNGRPTFIRLTEKEGQHLTSAQLNGIPLTNLKTLIAKSQLFLEANEKEKAFFLIEPSGNAFIMHHVDLINPEIKIKFLPDVVQTKPDNSAFEQDGLKTVSARAIGRFINQTVITTGKIMSTAANNDDNLLLLYVNAVPPNHDFGIVIAGQNLHKFDAAQQYYKGKQVKVVGKVTMYKGKPVITVTDPNQIQLYGY